MEVTGNPSAGAFDIVSSFNIKDRLANTYSIEQAEDILTEHQLGEIESRHELMYKAAEARVRNMDNEAVEEAINNYRENYILVDIRWGFLNLDDSVPNDHSDTWNGIIFIGTIHPGQETFGPQDYQREVANVYQQSEAVFRMIHETLNLGDEIDRREFDIDSDDDEGRSAFA